MTKIIDFEKKGNVVRFYLGDENCDDYWGDDWDDRNYEDNAGRVYDNYVVNYADVSYPFDCHVLEPADGWNDGYGSRCSKKDMKDRKIPCLIITPMPKNDNYYYDNDAFYDWVGCADVHKIYFGDSISDVLNNTPVISLMGQGYEDLPDPF